MISVVFCPEKVSSENVKRYFLASSFLLIGFLTSSDIGGVRYCDFLLMNMLFYSFYTILGKCFIDITPPKKTKTTAFIFPSECLV